MSKKLTIEAMRELAKQRGGKCLSDTYVNSHSKLLWQCARGHQWTARPNDIQQGKWCPHCGHGKKTIQDMHRLAETRGGRCLSDVYGGALSKLTWQCAEGHQWRATPSSIQQGSWCLICQRRLTGEKRRLSIGDMRSLAQSHGGKCLSETYVNSRWKLLWQCAKGHKWMAVPNNVRKGGWCRRCGRDSRKNTIEQMQALASKRGGRCVSPVYVDSGTKLTWQCAKGHQWKATPSSIQGGHWCPRCTGHERLTIEEMQRVAETRGGQCLSRTYVNNRPTFLWQCAKGHQWKAAGSEVKKGRWCLICAGMGKPSMDDIQRLANERGGKLLSQNYRNALTKLEWECGEGHQWQANWNNIQQGQWCPECSAALGERICREYFSQLFQKPFPKSRPKWLVNKDGNQMELDGYCATLVIAFEHQGRHHSEEVSFFHRSRSAHSRRQEDDETKRRLCDKESIALVIVPEIPKHLPLDQVRARIKEQLVAKGIPLPQDFDTRDVDISKAYRTPNSRGILSNLQTIAKEHGGQCLSTDYVNDRTKLWWQCARGHKWEVAPGAIKQGQWCPYCVGRGKTIQDMQQLAAQKGGKCLSPAYEGPRTKLLWECSQGHQWQARPNDVLTGHWCPKCAGSFRLTLEEMKEIAASRGGRCLSDEYVNSSTHLLWQCEKGHQWKATPNQIKHQRTWCPECFNERRRQGRSKSP